MKKFILIVGAAALGLAAYVLLNPPVTSASPETDELDEAGKKVGTWGTKQRVTGTGDSLSGHVKQAAGAVTGDDQLQGEGALDRVQGAVKDAVGSAAQTVEETIHGQTH